ncbi:Hsp70 family protein [Polymorphospora lycopeni]|uniref:Hsp70 family protein n=1 Tax=Polymorphospora lycopeni TaxID=3140240 RepID=A0ABV5D397_9ACTN
MGAYRLAIDLGSSNTVAVLDGAGAAPRPLLFDGSELLPSAVFARTGTDLLTGRDAERFGRVDPAGFEPHPKRRIDDGMLLLGAHQVDVRDALAAVLARVRAEAGLPNRRIDTVLTCPDGWGAARRRVLAEAADRAGLGPVRLVGEAVAAAAYFAARLGPHPAGTALAIVDIGGGTTDVAVVRRGDDLEVVARAGADLGGADIDAALVTHLVGGPVPADAGDRVPLWQEVRAAKESLSRTSHTPLRLPGRPAATHLTRDELETVAAPVLAGVGALTERVVTASGVAPERLAGVFLVGGGSRIPLAAHVLHSRLGIAPTTVERPETAVVEGALVAVPPRPADRMPAPPTGEPPTAPPTDRVPAPPAPAPPPPAPPAPAVRARHGWARPVLLAAVVLCFGLPFATVSCGLPGGYGRAEAGGTTTYRGGTLVTGTAPEVSDGHLAAPADRRPDRLPPQLPLLAAALAVIGALVVTLRLRARPAGQPGPSPGRRPRPDLPGRLCVAAAVLLVAGELLVLRQLTARVDALGTVPANRDASDYVGVGIGFWLALLLLLVLIAADLRTLLRGLPLPRRR